MNIFTKLEMKKIITIVNEKPTTVAVFPSISIEY